MEIDVAIPTKESETVIPSALSALDTALQESPFRLNRLIIVDDDSRDGTVERVNEFCASHGWQVRTVTRPSTLPEARQIAIDLVETDWFLFLDDDVEIDPGYLERITSSIAPNVGAIQGRKRSRNEQPSVWVRRRSRRGGTHATLLRRSAAAGVEFPSDLTVLEDEYLRRHVESKGFLWVFDHQARFAHASQHRHPIGWREGYLAGKYGLKPFHEVALNVPYSLASRRNPWPHLVRSFGWLVGRLRRKRDLDEGSL